MSIKSSKSSNESKKTISKSPPSELVLRKLPTGRINKISLSQKHEIAFRIECHILSQKILQSLYRLSKNPSDKEEIKNIVQSADIVIGNSKFLNDIELEKSATLIVKSFKGITNVRKKIDEYYDMLNQFESILSRNRSQKLMDCILLNNLKSNCHDVLKNE